MLFPYQFSKLLVISSAILFTLAPANAQTNQSFVSSFVPSTVRTNYNGYVGMQFTIGSSAVTVTALGRMNALGFATGVHTLKLVNAQTSADIPGGTVQVTMVHSSNGSVFNYANLAAPLQLQANTTYRLLSQEATSNDSWFDLTPVTTTSIANVTGGVYTDSGGNQIFVSGSTGESYVPLTFLYGSANPVYPPPTVTVSNTPGGAVPTYFLAQASASVGSIASIQFQLNGQNYGAPVTTLSPGTAFYITSVLPNSLLNGATYLLTAIAADSFGDSATSAPVTLSYATTDQPLLTAQTLGALRNNYGDAYGHFVGTEFTVGNQPLDVYELGRYVSGGNNQSHLLKLVNAATGVDVPGGSVIVSLAGVTAGQYAYGYFASPVVLSANTAYYLVSQEMIGGDQWHDLAPVTPGSLATVNGAVYQDDSGVFNLVKNTANYSYIPLNLGAAPISGPYSITIGLTTQANATYSGVVTVGVNVAPASASLPIVTVQFEVDGKASGAPITPGQYQATTTTVYQTFLDTTQLTNGAHTLAAIATDVAGNSATASPQTFTVKNSTVISQNQPFITAFQPTFLRNNFGGYVGMEFTTGGESLSITSLGRYCAPGNSGVHTVKLAQVSDGSDLPGGSVSIAMTGCTAGQFVYASLTNTITLPANSYYYLASQEFSGGDQWYDYSSVTTAATAATVVDPVYFDGSRWVAVGSNSLSRPPVLTSSYVPVNFRMAPVNGNTTLTVTEALIGNVVTAAPVSSGKILGVQFQIDGANVYAEVTAPPYTLTVPILGYGTHQITAIARDSLGNVATSAQLEDDQPYPYYSPYFQNGFIGYTINFSPTTLRNNYTGWVGFQFTMKGSGYASPAQFVQSPCVTGNTQKHVMKLVFASTGLDVPGGAMLGGCGSIVPLPQVTPPGASYFLVIQETSGGDSWYDISPSVATPLNGGNVTTSLPAPFTIDGPVYFNGSQYVLVPLPNYAYAGMLFGGFITPF